MSEKKLSGWEKIKTGFPWFESEGNFPLPAYSEFMPPPRLGIKPYGETDFILHDPADNFGINISELDEETVLKPGLSHIIKQVMHKIVKFGSGHTEYHITGHHKQNLKDNPYWPEELSEKAAGLKHERFVSILPFALSKTQDDKGRVPWTLFGNSEINPGIVFWKSFFKSSAEELPESAFTDFAGRLLNDVYSVKPNDRDQLLKAGLRIMISTEVTDTPSWIKNYQVKADDNFKDVTFLLTFIPFGNLPKQVKEKYLSGHLNLLPCPGSLVFWGMPTYNRLKKTLPFAGQIPMLKLLPRQRGHNGLRVPQSGWIHEPHPHIKEGDFHKELVQDTYHRTHRWQKVHKFEDDLIHNPKTVTLIKALFSTEPEHIDLYDKPVARNCQIWSKDFDKVLDGPHSNRHDILKAEKLLSEGGLFGFRFMFPPMRIGTYDMFWHRPAVSWWSPEENQVKFHINDLTGVITGYNMKDPKDIIELWPRLLKREPHFSSIHAFNHVHDHYSHQTALNIINLFECWEKMGKKPLTRKFARSLIRINKHEDIDKWLESLPSKAYDAKVGNQIREKIEKILLPADKEEKIKPLTFDKTKERSFEENWWKDIHFLAHGEFINKDNADCVQDDITKSMLPHHHRDLEKMGDYFIYRHKKAIEEAGMQGKATCGELPFKWHTDFVYDVFGGWKRNNEGHTYERNIICIIPGKNRKEAVVMADHYDTAYMADVYEKGARISAAGADDNYTATATLLQAAPILLQLAKEGKLERDVWLVHLTGEEFPADCMGARHFCRSMIEKKLKFVSYDRKESDISGTTVVASYVMDMIGHNKDSDKDIFQISPGKTVRSLQAAHTAHLVNLEWNILAHKLNHTERMHLGAGKRVKDVNHIPEIAKHLALHGEVRTHYDPHSSIYNTDGQIFSDTGIPCVLFMENYDLNRTGYHDMFDTMENIDLDYGAAFAAIAIESAAQEATRK